MGKRFLLVIGFIIAFPLLGVIMLVYMPIAMIVACVIWVLSGKDCQEYIEKPIEWCFNLPFKISDYNEKRKGYY